MSIFLKNGKTPNPLGRNGIMLYVPQYRHGLSAISRGTPSIVRRTSRLFERFTGMYNKPEPTDTIIIPAATLPPESGIIAAYTNPAKITTHANAKFFTTKNAFFARFCSDAEAVRRV